MGLSGDVASALLALNWGVDRPPPPEHIREAGLDPENRRLQYTGYGRRTDRVSRHLSQHVGGFIITNERLDKMVPIGNAAMADALSSNGTRMI